MAIQLPVISPDMKSVLGKLKEAPPDEVLSVLMAIIGPLIDGIGKALEDPKIKEAIGPRLMDMVGRKLAVRIDGIDGMSLGLTLIVAEPPQWFNLSIPDEAGLPTIHMELNDFIDILASAMEERALHLGCLLLNFKIRIIGTKELIDWMPLLTDVFLLT